MPQPDWSPGSEWEPIVTCTCVESGGEVALLDPPAHDGGDHQARPRPRRGVLDPDHPEPGFALELWDGDGPADMTLVGYLEPRPDGTYDDFLKDIVPQVPLVLGSSTSNCTSNP